MNIRTRLTLAFALLVMVMLGLFSTGVYMFSSYYRRYEFFQRLEERGRHSVHQLLEMERADSAAMPWIISNSKLAGIPERRITIFNDQLQPIFDSRETPSIDLLPKNILVGWYKSDSPLYRDDNPRETLGFTTTVKGIRYLVVCSGVDKYGRSKLNALGSALIAGYFLAIVLVVMLGWFYANQALKPITDIVRQVDEITANRLNRRLKVNESKDELNHLSVTFNRMLDRLQESFETQRNFVSHASHELRTPITKIKGEIEVALIKTRSAEEYQATYRSLLEELNGLKNLSNGLLELASLDSPAIAEAFENIPFEDCIYEACALLKTVYPDSYLEINIPEMPNEELRKPNASLEDLEMTVLGNRHLLQTAIYNLLENACKYSNPPAAFVKLTRVGKELELTISDKGIGITPKDLKAIRQPFYRSENVRNYHGHGVGLSLTDRIVQMHKGTMDIESHYGKGTTIRFTLPRAV